MFELRNSDVQKGSIEVICGCMFSGKTEELLRRVKSAQLANQRVDVFKPAIDKRYDAHLIVSHDLNVAASKPVENAYNILPLVSDASVVAIDEAQFFDDGLPVVAEQLAKKGLRVIVAGLDMDFKGEPFGPMPALLAVAQYVTKLQAVCIRCGSAAHYSYRKADIGDRIVLGEKDMYEPRCRACFNNP